MKPQIKVLIAEDHPLLREGLRWILEREPDLEVVGEAEDGREAVAMAQTLGPDVVLMDIGMPLLNGIGATRQLKRTMPKIRVLILTGLDDDGYVESAKAAGAAGFLLSLCLSEKLCRLIRDIHLGNSVFRGTTSRPQKRSGSFYAEFPRKDGLTQREVEVVQLIAEGKSNKEVASQLKISTKTVRKHRQNVMGKLNVHDASGLTRYAVRTGIIECKVRMVNQ